MLNCRIALRCGMTALSLLLPFHAAPDSQVNGATPTGKAAVAAHVDFKIVIPQVLSLDLSGGGAPGFRAQTVAIYSNGRNVTLAASGAGSTTARRGVILRAAARKVIAQEAACRSPADAAALICTVAMP
jgi:hypothetical protein